MSSKYRRGANVKVCVVPGCFSDRDKNRKYYLFPIDREKRELWIKAIGRPELMKQTMDTLIHLSVCDLHFDPYEEEVINRKKRKQGLLVVPTLNLTIWENENPSKMTQTINEEATELKIKKLKYKEEIQKTLKDRGRSAKLKTLIKLQRELEKKFNKFNEEKIHFCALCIFLGSPQSYRILGQILDLPSERTLRKTFVGTNLNSCLSSNMLQCLQARINNFSAEEKYCIICADEIELKSSLYYQINRDKIIGFHEIEGKQTAEPATHALVVMARGIFSDWHQPLGYCFLGRSKNNRELNTWIDGMIRKALYTGLKVVAFVPAQGSFFYHMAKERLAPHLETYFTVDETAIHFIFDLHELMKSLIYDLMTYDFEFHDVDETNLTATWNDIESLHRIDSERARRLAPGLTKCHVDQSQARNMNTDLVKEIYSKKVAAAMNFYKDQGLIGEECIGTIKLIALLNETCDILNSSLATYPTADKNQMEILNRFLDFLFDVTIRDKNSGKDNTNSIQCLNGLKISLKSIIDLKQSLLWQGYRALPTRRLNQSVLQEFFCKLREHDSNPTPLQLSRAFQKLFMTKLMSHNKHSDDLDQLLEGTEHAIESISGFSPEALKVYTVDYRFNVPKQHALWYVSGYLFNRCYAMHQCLDFIEYLSRAKKTEEYNDIVNLNPDVTIRPPPDTFVALIKLLDDRFVHCLLEFARCKDKTFSNIGNEILASMSAIKWSAGCACFPLSYLKKLFIRFRIFNIIRCNNKNFKCDAYNLKCFRVNKMF